MPIDLQKPPIWLFILAILCIGFATYANSLNGGFKWDDHPLIENNRSLETWRDTSQVFTGPLKEFPTYYRPTQLISYKLDHLLWGSDPKGYHLSSVLLHLTNALLFFFLLSLTLHNRHAAFWGALLFCCHPALTEPVNYISSRSDLLVGTFTLLTMIFFWSAKNEHKERYLILALVSFALSLLSKEIALVTPLVLLTWEHASGKDYKKTIPFFLIALLSLSLRRAIIPPQPVHHIPLFALLSAPQAFMKYLLALVCPSDVAKTWSIPLVFSLSQKEFLVPLLGILAFGTLAFAIRSRSKRAFFGIAWFLISLGPFLFSPYLIPTLEGYPFSYAWLYLPSLGLFFALSSLADGPDKTRRQKRSLKVLLPCALLLLCGLTVKTNTAWTAPEIDFIQNILRHRADSAALSPLSLNYIGAIFEKQNRFDEATRYFRESIRIDPYNSNAHFNLGIIRLKQKDRQGAKKEFETAVLGDYYNIGAHYNLAILYANDGEDELALKEIALVLQFEPDAFKRPATPKRPIRSY